MALEYFWYVGWVKDEHSPEGRPWLIQQRDIYRAKEQLELIRGTVFHIEEVKLP